MGGNDICLNPDFPCDGVSLSELLTYDGTSYWWFIYDALMDNRFDTNDSMKNTWFRLAPCISLYLHPVITAYDSLMKFLYSTSHSLICRDNEIKKQQPIVFFHTYHVRWVKTRDTFNKSILRNTYYDNIIQEIPKHIQTIPVYDSSYNPCALLKYIEILNKYNSLTVSLHSYWSSDIKKKEIHARNYFYGKYLHLTNNADWLATTADALNIPVNELISRLKYLFLFEVPSAVKYSEMLTLLMKQIPPNLMFLVSEQTITGRAWLDCAKKKGVEIIALQHGYMRDLLSYTQNKILPNILLVWSEIEREIVTKHLDYSEDMVCALGNPRFDNLSFADQIYSKSDFISQHNITADNWIVFWATSFADAPYGDNVSYIIDLSEAVREIGGITLLVKLHPLDDKMYKKLILQKFVDLPIIIMDDDSDVSELIYISDILIMQSSTVGEEAVILNKPIIELNYSGEICNYVQEGVAILVNEKTLLKDTIYNLLHTSFNDSKLIIKQNEYMRKHMYDGKSSKRISQIIVDNIFSQK